MVETEKKLHIPTSLWARQAQKLVVISTHPITLVTPRCWLWGVSLQLKVNLSVVARVAFIITKKTRAATNRQQQNKIPPEV